MNVVDIKLKQLGWEEKGPQVYTRVKIIEDYVLEMRLCSNNCSLLVSVDQISTMQAMALRKILDEDFKMWWEIYSLNQITGITWLLEKLRLQDLLEVWIGQNSITPVELYSMAEEIIIREYINKLAEQKVLHRWDMSGYLSNRLNKLASVPEVGIFWIQDGKVYGDGIGWNQGLKQKDGDDVLFMYPQDHPNLWPKIRDVIPNAPEFSYDEIPRGRIYFNFTKKKFHIMVGPIIGAQKELIKKIADYYGLLSSSHYQVDIDEKHYGEPSQINWSSIFGDEE